MLNLSTTYKHAKFKHHSMNVINNNLIANMIINVDEVVYCDSLIINVIFIIINLCTESI